MKTTKVVTREIEETAEVRCNKCGDLCSTPKREIAVAEDSRCEWYGLIGATFSAGYFSEVFEDGHKFEWDMCEPCLKQLFASFKIPAKRECSVHGKSCESLRDE